MRFQYHTALLMAGGLVAGAAQAQIVNVDVAKSYEIRQIGPNTLIPFNGGTNAFFYARTFYQNPGDFDGGSLSYPAPGSPKAFNIAGQLDCCGHLGVGYSSGYMTPAAMNAAFPTGINYTLTATNSVTSASQSVVVPYSAEVFTANLPKLDAATWNALQNANPNQALMLSWNAFTPNPGATFGQGFFTIRDVTLNTTLVNFAGFAPSTTSYFLAANSLTAGHNYAFELIFDDVISGRVGNVLTFARSDLRTFGTFSAAARAAIPEPSTWALMIAGFGLAGSALRRRRAIA